MQAMSTLIDYRSVRPPVSWVRLASFGPLDRERPARRFLNIAVAAVGLVVAAPLMLVIAALIKLTSRGPVLFAQIRVGLDRRALSNAGGNTRRHTDVGGLQFTMYKFRTMRPADTNGPQVWAQPDDARVTPLGRVLRKFRRRLDRGRAAQSALRPRLYPAPIRARGPAHHAADRSGDGAAARRVVRRAVLTP